MLGLFRQKMIEELIAEGGGRCTYCNIEVRRNWNEYVKYDHDATIDHIVPKSKGGENSKSNYALACRRCNHAKSDRSVEEFLADPRQPQERAAEARRTLARRVKYVPVPDSVHTGYSFMMPLPRGATLPKESGPAPGYSPPRRLTGVELARAVAKVVDRPKKRRKYVPPIRSWVKRKGFWVVKKALDNAAPQC